MSEVHAPLLTLSASPTFGESEPRLRRGEHRVAVEIAVDSESGVGSTSSGAPGRGGGMTNDDGGKTMDVHRSRILIADDDEDILELVRLRLSRAGHELLLARNGADALELARSRRLDLAILDVSMPAMDGYEVTRQLRADPATSELPIVLLTARAQTAEVARGFEAGADDYVTKPFSPGELQRRVEEILDGKARGEVQLATITGSAA